MTTPTILTRVLLTLTAVIFSGNAFAQQPESYTLVGSGHVNDYANIINQPEEDQIRAQLQDYQEKTTIEFALVTVPSLGGMSIEEFTNRLANHWGVGDKQKDNGLVLLIAPVEGDLRIEVGDGLQGDLTDGTSGALLDRHMMPILLEINNVSTSADENTIFTKAAVAGVSAVINHLGGKPYAQRLEERHLAEQKAAEEARLRAEQTRTFMMFAVPIVVVVAVLILVISLIVARKKREEKLKDLFSKNGRDIQRAKELLVQAERKLPEASGELSCLTADHPRIAWKDIAFAIGQAPQTIKNQIASADGLNDRHSRSNWQEAESESKAVSTLLTAATALAGLAGLVRKRREEISEARSNSPKLTEQYSTTEEELVKVLDHKDVKDSTRELLKQAKEKRDEALAAMKPQSGVNWLGVYALLTSALALLDKAKSSAQANKRAADEARRPKPTHHRSTLSTGTFRPSGGMRIGGGGGFSGGGASRSFRR